MRKSQLIGAALVVSVVATMVASPGWAADTPPSPVDKPGYTLDFHDEFNGTDVDRTKWTTRYLPHWTDTPANTEANFTIANGILTQRITQDQPKWDADIHTNLVSSAFQTYNDDRWVNYGGGLVRHPTPRFDGYKTRYGYFEVRAKMSTAGGGGHQAWWMVGTDDVSDGSVNPEIDIIETFFTAPNNWRIAAYGWGDPNFLPSWYLSDAPLPSGTPTAEFHKYAMDWTPTQLRFYYDDVLYRTINDAPNMPMAMILNIYTGAGSGMPNGVWPKEWQVDYVRVWKDNKGYGETYSTISDRWHNRKLHVANHTGFIQEGVIAATEAAAQWEREPYTSSSGNFIRYRNKLTGEFIDTYNVAGTARAATTSAEWWSSQFTEEPVAGTPYVRLKSRHYGDYLHNQNSTGQVERGAVPATWWSNQWLIQPAP